MTGKVDLSDYGYKKIEFNGTQPRKTLPRVVVGLSGGVDSSVTAYILKWQGYDVIGLFMKNWDEQDEDGCCTAEADFNDVKRVCEKIEIPYYSVNFADEYMERVFNEFLVGLKNGWTPNPDILCNREIKFSPFLQRAKELNADYIATGHYAGITRKNGKTILCKAADGNKDQSYFLCGLSQEQLGSVLFPLSDIKKTQVREIAAKLCLINAKKKDSTGICFIGERKIKQFLSSYLGNQKGEIRTLDNKVVGTHDGLMYYTIGQRRGLTVGGFDGRNDTKRWFVIKKDIKNNILYVNNGDCPELYAGSLVITDFNPVKDFDGEIECCAKIRYRQPDQSCTAKKIGEQSIDYGGNTDKKNIKNGEKSDENTDNKYIKNGEKSCGNTGCIVSVKFKNPQRAVTLGQWCVLYDGNEVIGGGIISEVGK